MKLKQNVMITHYKGLIKKATYLQVLKRLPWREDHLKVTLTIQNKVEVIYNGGKFIF